MVACSSPPVPVVKNATVFPQLPFFERPFLQSHSSPARTFHVSVQRRRRWIEPCSAAARRTCGTEHVFGSHGWGQLLQTRRTPPARSWNRASSLVGSWLRAINWTKTEPAQRGNYSFQPNNSFCSFLPSYYILCPSFFPADCISRPRSGLGRRTPP